jgi:hypothetical protein
MLILEVSPGYHGNKYHALVYKIMLFISKLLLLHYVRVKVRVATMSCVDVVGVYRISEKQLATVITTPHKISLIMS